MRDRILVYNYLRVFACAMIVYHHLYGFADIDIIGEAYWINLGYIGVALFVFTSGGSLYHRYGAHVEMRTFMRRRFQRIYPLLWVVTGFQALIFYLSSGGNVLVWYELIILGTGFWFWVTTALSPLDILLSVPFDAFWFVGLIIMMYVSYPVIAKGITRHPRVTVVLLFVVFWLTRLVPTGLGVPRPVTYRLPGIYTWHFGLGMLTSDTMSRFRGKENGISVLAARTYAVFLIHWSLKGALWMQYRHTLPEIRLLTGYILLTLLVSEMLYRSDTYIQARIRRK